MILVFGAINLDLIFTVPGLPQPDEMLQVHEAACCSGGKGANQAVAAARDGGRVALAGAVGTDALAGPALAGPIAAGVDVSRVARLPGTTGLSSICRDAKQQSQIVTSGGANLRARASQVEDAVLRPGTVLLLEMGLDAEETASLILRARARGARVLFNFAPPGMISTDALRAVDVLLLDEGDSGWLSVHLGAGVGAASLRAALGVTVVRTLGVSGLEYADAAGTHLVPPHRVQEIDRTGAQDCLAGVLAATLDRGAPLGAALRRAVVAAGLSTTRIGPQASMPDRDETDRALEQDLSRELEQLRSS